MLGLDAAGKTMILYRLKLNKYVTTIPAKGINVETVSPCKGVTFTVWNVGGQRKIRPLWRHYFQNTQGLIFVVDSSDLERISEARQELFSVMESPEMEKVPVIVIGNKQDLPRALKSHELAQQLCLLQHKANPWHVQEACAKNGEGIYEAMHKLSDMVKEFEKSSRYWSDKNDYNLAGGETGFDTQETKLPTYWNTSFSKICLGMKIGQQINFIVINKQANSLYSLIADGQYRATSLGRNTWKTLIGSQASLQYNCNKEGFNAASGDTTLGKARIGFLGNNEKDCYRCDSRIGFGTGGRHDDSNTCGNEAMMSPDNGDKHIKAVGYILVE
ncbi:hypothetical protein ACROYT_G041156 [Oculina patagonica]